MKKTIFIVVAILAVVLIIFGVYKIQNTKLEQKSNAPSTGQAVIAPVITKENLHQFLSNQQFVKDLPEDSVISLRLYNFDKGEREWEADYKITTGKAEKIKAETYDVEMVVHSKYLNDLARDTCTTLKTAKANGDVGFNTALSTTELLWKYKSMLKYRNCLGV